MIVFVGVLLIDIKLYSIDLKSGHRFLDKLIGTKKNILKHRPIQYPVFSIVILTRTAQVIFI